MTEQKTNRKPHRFLRVRYLCSIFLLVTAAAIFAAAASQAQLTDTKCDRHTYPWSPALDIIHYHWETFENHQFSIKTPYFGFKPTDDVEDAWNKLLPTHPIGIPSSRLGDLGQTDDPTTWARDPNNSDAILALPEYAVQLGCLNFLRQLGYRSERDFNALKAFQGGDALVWERAYQCLERLRQAIMCWSDVGAIALYYDDHEVAVPKGLPDRERDVSFDFGTLHKCRNFDDLNAWTKDNGVQGVPMESLWG
ncbi:hypothetical protein B0T22DRAFT_407429 [Podospora appendiculata]|uniref:Uncharacterized protein n=1 Tax=Podospora appendiculata TaxID=314037 RepID=A0AAE0XAL2_9PEZI|nr:hypothetical protein B0T22DRAFT_407429 [Podospora appendiculata]